MRKHGYNVFLNALVKAQEVSVCGKPPEKPLMPLGPQSPRLQLHHQGCAALRGSGWARGWEELPRAGYLTHLRWFGSAFAEELLVWTQLFLTPQQHQD